jgi:hypothetical protein
MDIFRKIKSLRAKGDIRGAEELERLVEKRRASSRFFEGDPKAAAWRDNLRRARGRLRTAEDES